MKDERAEEINHFLKALSLTKAQEIKANLVSGTITKLEAERALLFKDLPLSVEEKDMLLTEDYSPIEGRLSVLTKNKFYNDTVLIGTLFLCGNRNNEYLYDKELNTSKISFKSTLYFYCIGLLESGRKQLCQGYIDLLQKLVIIHPSELNPPQDRIDKIGYRAYSDIF